MPRVLVIPDVHGSSHWKKAVTGVDEVDVAVFLGDYINSFNEDERGSKAVDNLRSIIAFKKKLPEKVVLLAGNHDLAHCMFNKANDPHISGYEHYYAHVFSSIFEESKDCFQIALKVDDWVFSHAGFTKTWSEWAVATARKAYNNVPEDPVDFANWCWKVDDCSFLGFNPSSLSDVCGTSRSQGPCWVRPSTLLQDACYDKQFVGHTEMCEDKPALLMSEDHSKSAVILDSHSHSLSFTLDTKTSMNDIASACEVSFFARNANAILGDDDDDEDD